MTDKDNRKPEMSRTRKVLLGITVGITVLFIIFVGVSLYSNQIVMACDNDLVTINKKINETGQISTDDPLFLKLGTDQCIDLSKTGKGIISQEIKP